MRNFSGYGWSNQNVNSLIAKLLGLDADQFAGANWSQVSIRFQGLPQSWWALATLVLITVLTWLTFRNYRRESESASPRMKSGLAALRLAALSVVMLALFQPTLVIDKSKRLPSSVVVLVDDSLSMSLADRYTDADFAHRLGRALGIEPEKIPTMPRLEIIRAMMAKSDKSSSDGWLGELTRRHKLKVMAFSDAARELKISEQAHEGNESSEAGKPPLLIFDTAQLQPTGVTSNIEAGLRQALASSQGQPIAAVVLLTDGQTNAGDAMAGAQALVAKNVPIFAIGLGSAEPPRNIEIMALAANNVIFKDDEAVFSVRLTARGFEGRNVNLILKQKDSGAAGEIVAQQLVTFGADDAVQEITLRVKPTRVGAFTFTAEIESQAGEVTDKDNSAAMAARVIDQKVKVLFVSGDSGREYRYLKNFLIRDKTIAAHVWLENASAEIAQESSAGEKPLAKLPREENELFAYDVVVLYDPQPRDFDAPWAKLLQKFVADRGGGVCYIAGNKYTEEFLFMRDFEPLTAMLPVTIERDSLAFREGISRINLQQWPLIITPQGLDHPALQFDTDPDRNKNLWAVMPGFYWAQPVARSKPGAAILAVHSDPRRVISDGAMPVVASQFYGAGRVLFLGMDATWRWRYTGARYYEQFWNQTVRYLSQGRLLGGRKRIEFYTDKETYNLGQRAQINAKVYAQDYTPAKLDKFDIELKGEGETKIAVTLQSLPGNPGQLEGTVLLDKVGLYEIVPKTDDTELAARAAQKNFRVILPRIEFQQPRMNEPLLADLARTTGGKFLKADEFENIPSLIPAREQILLNEVTQDLWDAPLMLLMFCGLLFTEWSLRKWKNMA